VYVRVCVYAHMCVYMQICVSPSVRENLPQAFRSMVMNPICFKNSSTSLVRIYNLPTSVMTVSIQTISVCMTHALHQWRMLGVGVLEMHVHKPAYTQMCSKCRCMLCKRTNAGVYSMYTCVYRHRHRHRHRHRNGHRHRHGHGHGHRHRHRHRHSHRHRHRHRHTRH